MHLLDCVEIGPRGPATASVVWMHGLGASGHDFEPIVPPLGLPHVRFVFPHAPARPVTINGGMVMPSWYDIRHLDFVRDGREDEAQIKHSTGQIEALLAREVSRGVPASRIVVAGFSQGGAIALHVGHRHAERLAGIMCLSSYLVRPTALAEGHPANADTPMLFQHGRFDDVVPIRAGRASYEAFVRPGRDVRWNDYPMAHEVCPAQVADIGRWLHERIG
ncbi:MAG: carboxylesterase [Pseudomonadota bacterium]|nr:carboxylesterase [Pseudomonadota bacterium]